MGARLSASILAGCMIASALLVACQLLLETGTNADATADAGGDAATTDGTAPADASGEVSNTEAGDAVDRSPASFVCGPPQLGVYCSSFDGDASDFKGSFQDFNSGGGTTASIDDGDYLSPPASALITTGTSGFLYLTLPRVKAARCEIAWRLLAWPNEAAFLSLATFSASNAFAVRLKLTTLGTTMVEVASERTPIDGIDANGAGAWNRAVVTYDDRGSGAGEIGMRVNEGTLQVIQVAAGPNLDISLGPAFETAGWKIRLDNARCTVTP